MDILKYFKRNKTNKTPEAVTQPQRTKMNPQVIKVIEGFKDRSRKDIDKWRQAIALTQLNDNPRFDLYHDLIDDLLTDGHLQSQIQMRITSTLNTDFHIINRHTGEENKELTFVFQQQWFFELLEIYLWHIIRGYKLIEFRRFEQEKIDIAEIPPRHLVPTHHKVIPDLSNFDYYVDYSNDTLSDWLLPFGKEDNLGLMNNIIPAIIWKRNVEQSWAEFCERFGIPLITATTPARDESQINDIHDMLIGIGEASVGTFPQGTDIKIHEANRTDAFNVYKEFIKLNMDTISKQLVGSTMLSDQGTNRSQTEVHERGLDFKIAQADKRGVKFMVNDQLFPLLQKHGYPISKDDVFEFKTTEQEVDLTELWNITNGLISNGYEVESDWLSKTFNIPLNEKKKNKPTEITASIVDERYPGTCSHSHYPTAEGLNISKLLIELTEQLATAVFDKKEVLGILGRMIGVEAMTFVKGMMKGFGKSETYTGPDKLVMQMMEYNCFDFACSKAEERHYAVASRLIDYEKGIIKSKADFISQCLKDNEKLNTKWLETEYNLAVATGQNSAAYVRAVQDAKNGGTRFYEYQTMGDDLVRPAHSVLDGRVFDILAKGDKAIWPPNGFGCRCEMIPHSGGVKPMDWEEGKAKLIANDKYYGGSQFMINRGDLKQVFTDKQFYRDIKGYPDKINEMTFDKYGLKSWDDMELDDLYLDKSIDDIKKIHELFKLKTTDSKKYVRYEDYLGRKISLRWNTYTTKTLGKKYGGQERVLLFPHIDNVLKNPDEVWLRYYGIDKRTGENIYQTDYIKFYNNTKIVVNTTTTENLEGIEINTWFSIDDVNQKERRKGILIKKGKEK